MKQFILMLVVFFNVQILIGQGSSIPASLPNILPPSPDAYSFTKYGNVPIGLNTGTAQFSIPIYTAQTGSLKLPVSLDYSSNGVKVDEMATRVGINWNLNAGGMITRVVLDQPDDDNGFFSVYCNVPISYGIEGGTENNETFTQATWDFYNHIRQATFAAQRDFQPDEYSYNVDGYSGKFLRRQNGQFTQYNSNGVKIEKNSNGFILTAPTGNRYYFYLSEIAHNYTTQLNETLEWIASDVPTAWYLTQIESPTRDTIRLNYSLVSGLLNPKVTYINGISQGYSPTDVDFMNTSDYERGKNIGLSILAPGLQTSVQYADNFARYVSSIDFKNGQIQFYYSPREDVIGEKKLDAIKVIRTSDNAVIKNFTLNHTYSETNTSAYDTYVLNSNFTNTHPELRKRLFLTACKEISNDNLTWQQYQFEYEDFNQLPPRLSFAQDRYGHFNGYANEYFFPNDTWFDIHLGNNHFGGNRTYRFKKAKFGVLNKITYPTGGYTKIEYEPNRINEDHAYSTHIDSVFIKMDTSTYINQVVISDTFHHNSFRELRLRSLCAWASVPTYAGNSQGGFTDFDSSHFVTVSVLDVNNNDEAVYEKIAYPNDHTINGYFGMYDLPPGTYKIKLSASRPSLRCLVSAIRTRYTVDKSDTAGICGIRVKSISDFSAFKIQSSKRQFLYTDWAMQQPSSGTGLNYHKQNFSDVGMTRLCSASYVSGFNTINSNSIFNIFSSTNNTVFYSKVIELQENSTNENTGGSEYEYYYRPKDPPLPIAFHWTTNVWNPVPVVPNGASYCNNDFLTGMLKSKRDFMYQQKYGNRQILQESINYYALDTPALQSDIFIVSKEMVKRPRSPLWPYFSDFGIYKYQRFYAFVKLDSTVTKSYCNTVMKVKNSFSYSMLNFLPNQTISSSSKGKVNSSFTRYVSDVENSNADYLDVYLPMYSANRISSPHEEYTFKDGLNIRTRKMRYKNFTDCGLILPYEVLSQQLNNNYTVDLTFEKYDNKGNLLQYKGRDGVTNSIIWGYNKSYPVAKIVGMGYDDAINFSGLSLTTINDLSLNDIAIRNELNKLRTNLIGKVFVNTLTYSPLIGVTSETDANGNTKFYEYDGFNRLKLIRDKNNNIIKKICYNFQGQQTECSETITLPPTTVPLCEDCIGADKKCIGNVCVTAKVKCFQSDLISPGLWNNTFRYEWPDLSYSPNITEVQNHPCLDTTEN